MNAPTADEGKTWSASMKHIAIERRCFVLFCNQYSTKNMYPNEIIQREEFKDIPEVLIPDGSCLVDPVGKFIIVPVVYKDEIIYEG